MATTSLLTKLYEFFTPAVADPPLYNFPPGTKEDRMLLVLRVVV